MPSTFQKVWNFVLGEYKVRTTKTASDENVQHVILAGTDGEPWTEVPVSGGGLVAYAHTRPTVATASSTSLIAANANRASGSFIINNNAETFWIEIGAAAVPEQCIPLLPGSVFKFETAQEIRGYQASGGSLSLDVYEAT